MDYINDTTILEKGKGLPGDCCIDTKLSKETLIYSETLKMCPSRCVNLVGTDGPLKVRIPVILSLTEIDMDLNMDLELEDSASTILDNKNTVYLDECMILPDFKTIFLSGYIRKAIEYAPFQAPDVPNCNVRHTVFNIPFKCAAGVEYFTPPQISMETRVPPKDKDSICEGQAIYLNEKVSCQLVSSRILKSDNLEECERSYLRPCIEKIEEKIQLTLTIRLVQEQDVNIYPGI